MVSSTHDDSLHWLHLKYLDLGNFHMLIIGRDRLMTKRTIVRAGDFEACSGQICIDRNSEVNALVRMGSGFRPILWSE